MKLKDWGLSLCEGYTKLTVGQREIIKMLHYSLDETFVGNYVDLSKAMGKPKSYSSNARKHILGLHSLGILEFVNVSGWELTIKLSEQWMERLIEL